MNYNQGCLDELFVSRLVEHSSWVDESREGKASTVGLDKEVWMECLLYPT
jgi:hypothetical protein